MANRLFRNLVCILFLAGLASGLEALAEQREVIKAESRPHWIVIEKAN